ncbi:MAG: hypothetical protein HY826_00440 [Actinobacteria bacterium]|nr:hypothetical protein [Actinomycetota bacterium]
MTASADQGFHSADDAVQPDPLVGAATKRRRFVSWAVGILAAVLCLVAIPQPLWKALLEAPQYHGDGALRLTAYGDRLVGDVCELNDLNHYIGMRRLGEPSIPCGSVALGRGDNTVGRIAPEMVLWLPAALVAAAAVLVIAVNSRRWLRRLALLFVWGFPVGVLVMTQYHLYDFGHDLDPAAAFHPTPFTPWVLGPSTIYQFSVNARPGLGLVLIVIAAAIATVLPRRLIATRLPPGEVFMGFTALELAPLLVAAAAVMAMLGRHGWAVVGLGGAAVALAAAAVRKWS